MSVSIVFQNPDGTENAPVALITKPDLDAVRTQQAQMQALIVCLICVFSLFFLDEPFFLQAALKFEKPLT